MTHFVFRIRLRKLLISVVVFNFLRWYEHHIYFIILQRTISSLQLILNSSNPPIQVANLYILFKNLILNKSYCLIQIFFIVNKTNFLEKSKTIVTIRKVISRKFLNKKMLLIVTCGVYYQNYQAPYWLFDITRTSKFNIYCHTSSAIYCKHEERLTLRDISK